MIAHERMSADFEKWHLGDGRALHRFTGVDRGGPHDHPWAFVSTILAGGYVERVYRLADDLLSWTSDEIERRPGDRFAIDATHIHEIIALPAGECWTLVEAGPAVREVRFWRFHGVRASSRAWHEAAYR